MLTTIRRITMAKRPTIKQTNKWNDEIHAHQDDQGYFDEPWWLDMQPTKAEIQEMVEDYLPFRWQ